MTSEKDAAEELLNAIAREMSEAVEAGDDKKAKELLPAYRWLKGKAQ